METTIQSNCATLHTTCISNRCTPTIQQFAPPSKQHSSTANQINSIPYVSPLLLRLHASNVSSASPFHIDPSKPTLIHADHGICPLLFNIPPNTANSCESSRSTTPFLFSSQLPSTGVPPHSHSLRKEPRKRERCN